MLLTEEARYRAFGLEDGDLQRLAFLGDRIMGAGFNVTGVTSPKAIEEIHFLDSLSLLSLAPVIESTRLVDLGSGAGLPALVLAIALPARITAVESQQKKCTFITETAKALNIGNLDVRCVRAEDYGRGGGRGAHDVAVSRALAPLPVVAEYSLPVLSVDGLMVAMKGDISYEERIQAQEALDILGGGSLESIALAPFPGATNRWVHIARKTKVTPPEYPRRVGVPGKRPLGTKSGG